MIVVCEKCRCSNQFGAVFCRNCGAKLQVQDMDHPDHRKINAVKRAFGKLIRLIIVIAVVTFVAMLFVPFGFKSMDVPDDEKIADLAKRILSLSYLEVNDNIYGRSDALELTAAEAAAAMRMVSLYSPDDIKNMLKVPFGEKVHIELYPPPKAPVKTEEKTETPKPAARQAAKQTDSKEEAKEKTEENQLTDFRGCSNEDGSVTFVVFRKFFSFLPLRVTLTVAAREVSKPASADVAGTTDSPVNNNQQQATDQKPEGFNKLHIVSMKIGHMTVPAVLHAQTLEMVKTYLCSKNLQSMFSGIKYVIISKGNIIVAFTEAK